MDNSQDEADGENNEEKSSQKKTQKQSHSQSFKIKSFFHHDDSIERNCEEIMK